MHNLKLTKHPNSAGKILSSNIHTSDLPSSARMQQPFASVHSIIPPKSEFTKATSTDYLLDDDPKSSDSISFSSPPRTHDSAFCEDPGFRVFIQAYANELLTIQVKSNSQSWTIFRSWQDCWFLHIHVMSTLPNLLGDESRARQIPVLPIEFQTHRLQEILEFYFEKLTSLLGAEHSLLLKFFQIKASMGDYRHSLNVEALSQLLCQLELNNCNWRNVMIKVSFNGRAKTWTVPRDIKFHTLLLQTSAALDMEVEALYYQNEFGNRAKLVGQEDLILLINSMDKLKFYLKE